MSIPFTQYLRPDGRRQQVSVERSPEIEAIAQEIRAKGYVFTCEVLLTGQVSLAVESPHEDEGDIDIEIVQNGPGVGEAVDKLVKRVIKAAH